MVNQESHVLLRLAEEIYDLYIVPFTTDVATIELPSFVDIMYSNQLRALTEIFSVLRTAFVKCVLFCFDREFFLEFARSPCRRSWAKSFWHTMVHALIVPH